MGVLEACCWSLVACQWDLSKVVRDMHAMTFNKTLSKYVEFDCQVCLTSITPTLQYSIAPLIHPLHDSH